MPSLRFCILGNPLIQKRHRHTKQGDFVRTYDPSLNDKANWRAAVNQYAPQEPYRNCALRMDVCWVFPRPNSHFGTGKNSGKLKPSAPKTDHHFIKPDRDNLDKIIMDAMTKLFWHDDSQVSQGFIKKRWGKQPATHVIITIL